MRLPIRARMTAWYVALLAALLLAVGAFVVLRLRSDLTGAVDEGLRPAVGRIALGYRQEGVKEFRDVAPTVLIGERPAAQILDPAGAVMATFGDPVARRPLLGAALRARALGGGAIATVRLGDGQRFRVAAEPVTRRGSRAVVAGAVSLAPVERSSDRVLVLLLLALPAALALMSIGGWRLASRALRPVDAMTASAGAIGLDRLHERLAVPATDDELAHLARTFNEMLARVEQGFAEQRRLVADTSHELRTPLAAMAAELDVSLRADELPAPARAVLESAREEVSRLSAMVDDLLTLARADEGRLELALEDVDLLELAHGVVADVRRRAHAVALEAQGEAVRVRADPQRMRDALRNLVDNAIAVSPPGARVVLRTGAVDGEGVIEVIDQGPGVPDGARERIFDRFVRLDASRSRGTGGAGLGLAIVREIAVAHAGRVSVAPRPGPGGGSVFALAVPLAGAGVQAGFRPGA